MTTNESSTPTRARAVGTPIGVAVVGAGRIGSHRARLAAAHPQVTHLVIADTDEGTARSVGEAVGAERHTTDWRGSITDPAVTAVVVATPEHLHTEAVLLALRHGKAVLVEKPLALSLQDAALLTRTSEELGGELLVGYSQRYKREHFMAKQELDKGSLGQISGVLARVYNTRATAQAILKRAPDATPVVDVLTYLVDLVSWLLGETPTEVSAQGAGTSFKRQGFDRIDDVTWALLRYPSGALGTLGVSYALPAQHPTQGQSIRFEMLGEEGSLFLDEDHSGNLLYTDRGYSHAYNPGHSQPAAYLGTRTPGDWALGQMFGPLAEETRTWLDHVSGGAPMHLATAREGFATLSTTLAIEESLRTGSPQQPVSIDEVDS